MLAYFGMIHVRYLCGGGCHCCFYLCFLFAEYINLLVFVFLSVKVEACQSGGDSTARLENLKCL